MSGFISLRGGLVLLLTGIGIFYTFKAPKWGIIAFIIVLYAKKYLLLWLPAIYSSLHLPLVFGILTLISWFIHSRKYSIQLPVQFWLMISFFIVICLSRYLSGNGIFDYKEPKEFFKYSVLFCLIVNVIRREKDLKEIIWILIIIGFYGFLFHYYHYKIGTRWKSVFVRPITIAGHRAGFAALMVNTFPLAYFYFIRKDIGIIIKIFLSFCMSSFIVGVILTYSRSGALALGAIFIAIALLSKRKTQFVVLILILGILVVPRLSEKYMNRLVSIKDYKADGSSMGRIATNQAAMNMLKTHPLFGIGAGNYNDLFLDYIPDESRKWVKPGKSIHNIFLQVAAETGLAGLLIFSSLIMQSFLDVIKSRKLCLQDKSLESRHYTVTGLGVALFGYLVHAQFHPGAYYGRMYIFIPLIIAARQICQRYKEGEIELESLPQKQIGFLSNRISGLIVEWRIKRSRKKFDKIKSL